MDYLLSWVLLFSWVVPKQYFSYQIYDTLYLFQYIWPWFKKYSNSSSEHILSNGSIYAGFFLNKEDLGIIAKFRFSY